MTSFLVFNTFNTSFGILQVFFYVFLFFGFILLVFNYLCHNKKPLTNELTLKNRIADMVWAIISLFMILAPIHYVILQTQG